ncbi:MAG: universal stress protein [Candidatus Rokuibacteriota bacterium]|nr:MAG: universal stress protein [Candidatus Rokubacteria bacterium]
MYKHILIPTDGSELSEMALRKGMAFAKSIGARTTVLTVIPPFRTVTMDPVMLTDVPEQYQRDSEAAADRYLGVAREAAEATGIACEYVRVLHDYPYEAIIDTASQASCDLIFMASHGRKGVAALLLGSETTKVLTHSKIPVLVCR